MDNLRPEEAFTKPPIKIGAIVATSGPTGLLGGSFVKAIQLAKEELKDTRRPYQLLVEEITNPDNAESAIEKLIQSDKVDALIVGLSMSGQIVKPYATAAKIRSSASVPSAVSATSSTPSPPCLWPKIRPRSGSPKPSAGKFRCPPEAKE